MLNKHSVNEKNKSPTVWKFWLVVKLTGRTNTSNHMIHFNFFFCNGLVQMGRRGEVKVFHASETEYWKIFI